MHYGGIYEDEIVGKAYDRRLMGRFIGYLRPYRLLVAVTLILLPPMAAARLAQPYLLKLAIDNHIVKGQMEGLPLLAGWFILLILAESLFTYAQVWLLQYVGQKVMFDLRLALFTHVQRMPAAFFDRTPTGSLVTRLTSDARRVAARVRGGPRGR